MADKFADDVIEELLKRLADGQGLSTICKDKRMPNRETVYRWMRANDELAERVMEAREIGHHAYAEATLELVEKCKDPVKARVILDARRWYLGKTSQAFADKPIVGISVSGDAGDAFAAVAGLLEGAATAIASRRIGSYVVDEHGAPRPVDAPGDGMA